MGNGRYRLRNYNRGNVSRIIRDGFLDSIIFSTSISQTLTGNTDNLVIPGLSTNVLIRITTTGNFDFTGLVNPDSLGRQIYILNVGTNNLVLKDNSSSSDPENRFLIGANRNVQQNEAITLLYDTINLRWRSTGQTI